MVSSTTNFKAINFPSRGEIVPLKVCTGEMTGVPSMKEFTPGESWAFLCGLYKLYIVRKAPF